MEVTLFATRVGKVMYRDAQIHVEIFVAKSLTKFCCKGQTSWDFTPNPEVLTSKQGTDEES